MKYAPLAQLDRVFGYEPKGQGFESLTACQNRGWIYSILYFCYAVSVKRNPTPKPQALCKGSESHPHF